jgi:hypothetical protein
MNLNKVMLVLLFPTAGTLTAQQPTAKEVKVTPLMSKDLADIRGKEVLAITVEYAPADRTLSTGTTRMDLSVLRKNS